jgi:hypothetical protein
MAGKGPCEKISWIETLYLLVEGSIASVSYRYLAFDQGSDSIEEELAQSLLFVASIILTQRDISFGF